ncbi:MAG: SDR family oxidoreductase [Gammaproteobacteria bacterium]|nr:SDR family oxidoreductase [Gammaproteobacteria bacterium]
MSSTVLVTGATRGIGRATVDRLVARGVQVVGIARSAPADGTFPGAFYSADLGDEASTAAALRAVLAEHSVDGLVNNAGLNYVERLDKVDLGHFREVIEVNLRASIQCAQALLPGMRERGYGRIVNLSSRGALGSLGRTSYGSAKAGVIGMTRTWAIELAAAGITANVVMPGPIVTEMFMRNNPDRDGLHERWRQGVPMKRFGRPEEVAAAIDFLLSADASYITGQVLGVCGGSSVGGMPL